MLSSAMLTLIDVLPLILSKVTNSSDEIVHNLIRLIQITYLLTSPFANNDTVAQLRMLIAVHHRTFKELFPNT